MPQKKEDHHKNVAPATFFERSKEKCVAQKEGIKTNEEQLPNTHLKSRSVAVAAPTGSKPAPQITTDSGALTANDSDCQLRKLHRWLNARKKCKITAVAGTHRDSTILKIPLLVKARKQVYIKSVRNLKFLSCLVLILKMTRNLQDFPLE